MSVVTKKESLLRQLSASQFATWELHIYLDTHSDDKKAYELYHKHVSRYETLKLEYESLYGPLSTGTGTTAEWLSDPWPWDITEEDC